jgi:3',5'-cyclic AMP phosphodiesterase CpdA
LSQAAIQLKSARSHRWAAFGSQRNANSAVSDLHFGKHNPSLVNGLKRKVEELKPDLLIATGDLADTPENGLFRQAFDVLTELSRCCNRPDNGPPFIAIPGNHDIWHTGIFRGPGRAKYNDTFGGVATSHYFLSEKVSRTLSKSRS